MSSLPAERPAVPPAGPPPAPPRSGSLNLARRPFVNTRPVTRVSILLWILGLLLLFGNVSLFWNYLSGSADRRAELERLQQDIQRQNQTIAKLQEELNKLDLEEQNRQVRFLNRKIAERTFSWSLLFDRLAEVLPDDVRLIRLAPKAVRKAGGRQVDEEEPGDGRVQLVIQAVSRSDEAHFEFVRRLFAHASFEDPDIPRETLSENGDTVEFDVVVTYIPGETPQGTAAGEDTPGEDTASPEVLEVPATTPAPAPESDR